MKLFYCAIQLRRWCKPLWCYKAVH